MGCSFLPSVATFHSTSFGPPPPSLPLSCSHLRCCLSRRKGNEGRADSLGPSSAAEEDGQARNSEGKAFLGGGGSGDGGDSLYLTEQMLTQIRHSAAAAAAADAAGEPFAHEREGQRVSPYSTTRAVAAPDERGRDRRVKRSASWRVRTNKEGEISSDGELW